MAGGKSSRMGQDKALLTMGGLPLWQRQLATLAALEPDEVLISGKADAAYAASGFEIATDAAPELGPLAGIAALLERAKAPLLLVLAVDMPHMTADFLRGLLSHCERDKGAAPEMAGFYEGLAAVFPKDSLPLAEAALRHGDRSIQRFVRDCLAADLVKRVLVTANDFALFQSVNSPQDLPLP